MADLLPGISPALLARANRRPNGELAWQPADALAAVPALAAAGYAVLGGKQGLSCPMAVSTARSPEPTARLGAFTPGAFHRSGSQIGRLGKSSAAVPQMRVSRS